MAHDINSGRATHTVYPSNPCRNFEHWSAYIKHQLFEMQAIEMGRNLINLNKPVKKKSLTLPK